MAEWNPHGNWRAHGIEDALQIPKDRDLLAYIAGYLERHGGISPTLRECAAALGHCSKGHIHKMLERLERRRLIRRLRYKPRAIELTRPVAVPRGPEGDPLYFIPVGTRVHDAAMDQKRQRNHG